MYVLIGAKCVPLDYVAVASLAAQTACTSYPSISTLGHRELCHRPSFKLDMRISRSHSVKFSGICVGPVTTIIHWSLSFPRHDRVVVIFFIGDSSSCHNGDLIDDRQHFQGLRRAQNKIDSNGSGPDGQRKADPTANPITRRPGPGRGRPRKAPPTSVAGADADQEQPPDIAKPPSGTNQTGDAAALPPPPLQTSAGASESSSVALEEPIQSTEEQPAKRQRLGVEEVSQPIDEDEAVLALAADGLRSAEGAYEPPE